MTMPVSMSTAFRRRANRLAPALALACAIGLCGCGFSETFQRGYVLQQGALEQIPVGASQEQVLIVMGTPSTVATVNGEVFYYISQKAERAAAFMPQKVVDQRVVAVYFDKERKVRKLADYGLKDGRVFDFYSRTTPTGGQELSYLRNIFKNINPLFTQ
jgi:outer membrane protein assembly factor BamE (lipoprotein component of BamABCDE complex)